MSYQVVFTPSAQQDLIKARQFYAKVDQQLGRYCADSLVLDTERLASPCCIWLLQNAGQNLSLLNLLQNN